MTVKLIHKTGALGLRARRLEVRRGIARGTCAAAIALCIGITDSVAGASDLALIANACWEYKRFSERDVRGAVETKLVASQLICFQPRGWATGLSFHGHDAWDWSYRFKIANHMIFLGGEEFGRVLNVGPHRMTVAHEGEPRTYRYVCRTKAESIQCERLHYRLSP
jgi:hypothetical protein